MRFACSTNCCKFNYLKNIVSYTGKEQNETVSASESSYTLQNLIEGQTYIINISAKMEEGQYGPWTTSKKVLFKSSKTFGKFTLCFKTRFITNIMSLLKCFKNIYEV